MHETTNLKRYSKTKCVACVSCKLYTYRQSQCLAWDTKHLQHADVIQTSTETSIRLRVSESLEIFPPHAQKTPQEVSLVFLSPRWTISISIPYPLSLHFYLEAQLTFLLFPLLPLVSYMITIESWDITSIISLAPPLASISSLFFFLTLCIMLKVPMMRSATTKETQIFTISLCLQGYNLFNYTKV